MLADIGWYLIPFLFAPGFCILVSAPSCPFIFLFGPLAKKQRASNWVYVDSVNPIPRGIELPQQFGSQWIQRLLVGLGVLKILRGREYDGSEGIYSVLNTLWLSLNLIMSLWTPLKKSIMGPHLSQSPNFASNCCLLAQTCCILWSTGPFVVLNRRSPGEPPDHHIRIWMKW